MVLITCTGEKSILSIPFISRGIFRNFQNEFISVSKLEKLSYFLCKSFLNVHCRAKASALRESISHGYLFFFCKNGSQVSKHLSPYS